MDSLALRAALVIGLAGCNTVGGAGKDVSSAGKAVTGAADWAGGPKKTTLKSIFLKPIPVTQANLDVVLKAGYIKKDVLCKGADASKVAACK